MDETVEEKSHIHSLQLAGCNSDIAVVGCDNPVQCGYGCRECSFFWSDVASFFGVSDNGRYYVLLIALVASHSLAVQIP